MARQFLTTFIFEFLSLFLFIFHDSSDFNQNVADYSIFTATGNAHGGDILQNLYYEVLQEVRGDVLDLS